MTTDQLASWLNDHLAWVIGGFLTWVVGISASIAVATFQNSEQQKTLDARAPAVEELARVGATLDGMDARLNRIENKLDKVLEKK